MILDIARRQAGMTLPEVLIAILLTLVVAAAGMGLLATLVRSESGTRERADQIQRARTFVERIGRELRQANSIVTASGSTVTMITYVHAASCGTDGGTSAPAILCRVTYSCSSTCTRTERNVDGSGTAAPRTVVTGLSGDSVFSFGDAYDAAPCPGTATATNPQYVCLRLRFPGENGDEAVTLIDGVELRNWYEPTTS